LSGLDARKEWLDDINRRRSLVGKRPLDDPGPLERSKMVLCEDGTYQFEAVAEFQKAHKAWCSAEALEDISEMEEAVVYPDSVPGPESVTLRFPILGVVKGDSVVKFNTPEGA